MANGMGKWALAVLVLALSSQAFAFSDVTLGSIAMSTVGSWGSTALTVNPEKKLLYLAAADDAASYVAQERVEPSALLRQAMDTERDFLHELQVPEAGQLTDHDLAVLVIDRAELFIQQARQSR